jgi:hypothetical protein
MLSSYTAPPETPASRDKLIQPFSRQNTECVPWFASFCGTQNDFPGQWATSGIGLQGYDRTLMLTPYSEY